MKTSLFSVLDKKQHFNKITNPQYPHEHIHTHNIHCHDLFSRTNLGLDLLKQSNLKHAIKLQHYKYTNACQIFSYG